ncbi:hypothetical protein KC887_02410 [Candidatus Kaiserbacteria bacterium]|nr:hypothetical protein [Candidatus Kaiserbacteria bacterium]
MLLRELKEYLYTLDESQLDRECIIELEGNRKNVWYLDEVQILDRYPANPSIEDNEFIRFLSSGRRPTCGNH